VERSENKGGEFKRIEGLIKGEGGSCREQRRDPFYGSASLCLHLDQNYSKRSVPSPTHCAGFTTRKLLQLDLISARAEGIYRIKTSKSKGSERDLVPSRDHYTRM